MSVTIGTIQLLRGTTKQWKESEEAGGILKIGQIGVEFNETLTALIGAKVGDGTHKWAGLPYVGGGMPESLAKQTFLQLATPSAEGFTVTGSAVAGQRLTAVDAHHAAWSNPKQTRQVITGNHTISALDFDTVLVCTQSSGTQLIKVPAGVASAESQPVLIRKMGEAKVLIEAEPPMVVVSPFETRELRVKGSTGLLSFEGANEAVLSGDFK